MPEEVVGGVVEEVEEEVEEVAFPGPEVPGWDRSVAATGVIHDRALP